MHMFPASVRFCAHVLGMLGLAGILTFSWAAETSPDPVGRLLEDIRAANQARFALANEEAAWHGEHDSLTAVRDGVQSERERLSHEAYAAEAESTRAEQELAVLNAHNELDTARASLATSAAAVRAQLSVLAASAAPGAITMPAHTGDNAFDDAMRALDASERAAASVAVEVMPGELAGMQVAAKILRIGGCCAWWVALDGRDAGWVRRDDKNNLMFVPAPDPGERTAITQALAMVEGRAPARMAILPLQPLVLAGATP